MMARQFSDSAKQAQPEFEPDWERIHEGRPYNGTTEPPLPKPRLASKWTPTREDQYPNGIDHSKVEKGHSPTPRWTLVMIADEGRQGHYLAVWMTQAARARAERHEYRRRVYQHQDSAAARAQFENSHYERGQ